MALHSRLDIHLKRKAFHVISGTLVGIFVLQHPARSVSMAIALSALAILGSLDWLRLKVSSLNKFLLKYFGSLMREEEKEHLTAQFYYLLGLAFVVFLMPRVITLQAIWTLAWMDPVAGFVGLKFGKNKWLSFFGKAFPLLKQLPPSVGSKTIEGSMAGFFAAWLAGIISWWLVGGADVGSMMIISAVGALCAVLAEAWPSQWDDNIGIPVWTSIGVWAAVKLLGQSLN
jgi:dolichol kinase